MEKFVCFVLCLAAFVSAGSALKCYSCDAEKLDGCIKSMSPKDAVCGAVTTNFKSVCVYKVIHDPAKKTDKVHAACEQIAATAAVNKDSLADCKVAPAGMEVSECRVCDTDLCNSSSMVSTGMISFLCLPLMYLVSKFVLS